MTQDNNILESMMQEGFVFENSPIQRTINEIAEHLAKNNNRTLQEEYQLVINRKSGLSKRLREMVIMLVETEMKEDDKEGEESIDKSL